MMQWRFSRSWNYHSSDFFRTLASMRAVPSAKIRMLMHGGSVEPTMHNGRKNRMLAHGGSVAPTTHEGRKTAC
jgi:hypothetical protein